MFSLFDTNKRILKRLEKIADKVLLLADQFKAMSDDDLRANTEAYKRRHQEGESLDSLLVEAFANVREASTRVTGMTPFKVQVMGGVVIHEGNIAEMKTGEGKTLTAVMPAYLNALAGTGVRYLPILATGAQNIAPQRPQRHHPRSRVEMVQLLALDIVDGNRGRAAVHKRAEAPIPHPAHPADAVPPLLQKAGVRAERAAHSGTVPLGKQGLSFLPGCGHLALVRSKCSSPSSTTLRMAECISLLAAATTLS